MRTICATGPGRSQLSAANTAPTTIAHGSGLVSAPRSERSAAANIERSLSPAERCVLPCAIARQSVLVTIRSIRIAPITGPAARSPSSATSSGTPMKPAFGNAATSAPNAASRRSTPRADPARRNVTAIVIAIISSAQTV